MNDFEGLHVVVTGGTGALGRAVVAALLERGATCHVPVFQQAELDSLPFHSQPRVHFIHNVDLSSERDVVRVYDEAGPLWASIHVAGGFAMSPIGETSAEQFMHMMNMNATSCFLCCREATRRIRAASSAGGRIVNVAARPALVPTGGMVAYAAAKSAVAAITLSLAEELRDERIWVNAVVPSLIDTPMNRASMAGADFGAWPKTQEIAQTMAFLASPLNLATRGALVPVYGAS